MKVRSTRKGNIKLVLSEDQACYVAGLLLNNDPKRDAPIEDPYGPLDRFLCERLGDEDKAYDRARMLTA